MFPVKEKTEYQAELEAWVDAKISPLLAKDQFDESVSYVKNALAEKTRKSFIAGLHTRKKSFKKDEK